MEPAQAKPVTKRRRWLIVALVLVVSTVAWWYWPRGDSRFVGKWAATSDGGKFNDVVRFRANGLASLTNDMTPGAMYFTWRVEGDRLIWGNWPRTRVSITFARAAQRLVGLTGNHWYPMESQFVIVDVTPDRMTLQNQEGDRVVSTWKRLPE